MDNILYNNRGELKIADLNLATKKTKYMTENVLCQKMKAPEIILGSTNYTSSIDMWSAGVILADYLLKKNKKALFSAENSTILIQ